MVVPAGHRRGGGPGGAGRSKVTRHRIFRTIFTSTVAISVASASVIWALIYNPSVKIDSWVVDLLGLKTQGVLLDPATALPAVAFMTIWTPRLQLHHRAGGHPGHSAGLLRQQPHRRRERLENVPLYYSAVAHAYAALPGDHLHDQRVPGVHPVQRADRQRRAERLDQRAWSSPCSAPFFKDNRYGFASAIAVVLFVVLLVLSVMQFRLLDRRVHYQ